MPLVISDEQLQKANLTEREARIELACRLFDIKKLELGAAAKFAGLSRAEFESELMDRKIPVIRYDVEDYEQDMHHLRKWGL